MHASPIQSPIDIPSPDTGVFVFGDDAAVDALPVVLPPHEHGAKIIADAARFNVLACGRRFGKTMLGIDRCAAPEVLAHPVGWFSPTYKMLLEAWREAVDVFRPILARRSVQERRLEFVTGGLLEFWSLDNPDVARGRKYRRVIIDEAAMVVDLMGAWMNVIRPTLADMQGDAFILSTPKGHNGFKVMYDWGMDPERHEWAAWRLPTNANPFILESEIEAMRAEMPEKVYQQEILAEFLENEGAVFRNIAACINAPQTSPEAHAGHRLVMGVDWGKHNDYTVMSVLCADCAEEVAIDRTNRIDYAFQRQRLAGLVQSWQVGQVLAESNAMGEPIIEQLQRAGLPVEGFQTTAVSKPPLIESLVLAFERVECQWLPDPIATSELEAFEQKITATGRSTYSAPEGLHDDTVIARCLAWRAATSAPWLLM